MHFKDFIRLYGVKNIVIGGWDYRISSAIKAFEWDLNYLGLEFEDRGFFKHIG